MTNTHPIATLIIEASLGKTKGRKTIIENINNGNLEVFVIWTKSKYKFDISYRKSNLFEDFQKCTVKNSFFLELITRSQSLIMNGKRNKAIEFLLSNNIAISILDLKNSKIGTDGKFLTFKMNIERNDKSYLSNLFWNFESLAEQFEIFLKDNQ